MAELIELVKERVARQAGLEAAQMRRFDELTEAQRVEVEWHWGMYLAGDYVYALRTEPDEEGRELVARRWRMW